ncbi:histidine--tRNA ligase [Xanthovirga aplysinae]|uniref:histidine--tRNA ligase n=1 Tax=Xanthovirga aplysinae TaxID=2529853 RepID=UPI0012BC9813|nr:histidine--tRNA ligase [Xanthovirga aplysinae]MTI33532.1 histidine--tRNA ligase [Xanthovirga aplysinae]
MESEEKVKKIQKPTIPKGTRDFGPEQMTKRNFIFEKIRSAFQKFGFLPLETPAMENLSVLTGKYGEEGDQLLYKILNSGDFLSKSNLEDVEKGYKHLTSKISERGLRYDLTVPFARYVVMNRSNLAFPFKRYQIQPVWRADRPQKGRYREFYQCDADVVGTNSLICEAEIVLLINEVFQNLNLKDFDIKINNRKILTGITEVIGARGREVDFCVAVDKLDKIGEGKVLDELRQKGFEENSIEKLIPFLSIKGSNEEKLAQMKSILTESEIGLQGVEETEEVFNTVKAFGLSNDHLDFDLTLARGLSYYTGAIFEVKAHHVKIGSITGGGRYDNLTGAFGMPDVSGVGISFGVDRIYDVMEELGLFPTESQVSTKVMLVNFDKASEVYGLGVLNQLRKAGINSEIFPESVKMKKQLHYANKKGIPFVILLGSEEIESGLLTLKDMKEGKQEKLPVEEIIKNLKSNWSFD